MTVLNSCMVTVERLKGSEVLEWRVEAEDERGERLEVLVVGSERQARSVAEGLALRLELLNAA